MSMYPQKISVWIVTSLETWLQCLIVLRVLNTVNKWAVVFICYEEQRKEDGQRIQAWLLWWPFLPKPILASWAEAEENGSRNCQRRSVRCSLRRLLQEPLWSSLSMKRIQFWCISSMKQLVFHVWRDAVVSNVTRVDLHRFQNTAMSLWCGFCRYWRRPRWYLIRFCKASTGKGKTAF